MHEGVHVKNKDDEYDYVIPAAYHDKEAMLSSSANFEPPCPCGQQMIGGLFGFLFGYIGLLFTGSPQVSVMFLSMGIAFGTSGSNVHDLTSIDKREFLLLFIVSLIFSACLTSIFDNSDLPGIFCISFIVSSATASLRSLLLVVQVFAKTPKELTRVCHV